MDTLLIWPPTSHDMTGPGRKRARKEASVSGKRSISERSEVSTSLKRQCQTEDGKRKSGRVDGDRERMYECMSE